MTHDQIERLLEMTASAVNELGNLVIETRRHNREMERLTETKQHSSYVKPENDLLSRTKFHHLPRPCPKLEWPVYDGAGRRVGSVFAHTAFEAGKLAALYYNPAATVTLPTPALQQCNATR